MKIINWFITIIVAISTFLGIDFGLGMNPDKNKTIDLNNFELIWEDNFDGTELDRNKWNDNQQVDALHWGAVRNGGYWHKDMISVSGGNLHIRTKYVGAEQAAAYGGDFKEGWYSGYVTTKDSGLDDGENADAFLYGYFETRCILPKGQGLWSAFWMMNRGVYQVDGSGVDGTEIDIFEGLQAGETNKTRDSVGINLHWDGYNEAHQHENVGYFYANNPYEEYNTYGVLWTEEGYIFYINGHECAKSTAGGVSKNPEWLLLSVEVSGSNAVPSGHGDITLNTGDVDFIVDYVRVYKQK